MITLGLVEAVDANGTYVTMPGSRGVVRGPFATLQNVVAGDRVLVVTTDDGESVVVGLAAASVPGVSIPDGSITSAKIANSTIVDADISAVAAIAVSKLAGHPTSTTDNTIPRFHSTSGELQTSSVLIDDNNRLRVASGSTGGLEIGSSGVLALSGTGGPSGIAAPVGSTWRQTDANATHGSLTGLLWSKVGTGTTEGTDWLVDYEGRWVTYTPTISGWTKGNGTASGSYTRFGRTMSVKVQLLTGSTTTQAPACTFSIPAGSTGIGALANVNLVDSGSNTYLGAGTIGADLNCYGLSTNGAFASLVGHPFAWTSGDYVVATATYEIA